VHKRILGRITGVFGRTENPEECIEETILITNDQLVERFSLPRQAFLYQLLIVFAHFIRAVEDGNDVKSGLWAAADFAVQHFEHNGVT